jgi:hypothetical protein
MDIPIPTDMQGQAIVNAPSTSASSDTLPSHTDDGVYTEEEKKALEDRLRALGYL